MKIMERCKLTWKIMPAWAKGTDLLILTAIIAYVMSEVF